MTYKAVTLDLDGTLLGSDLRIRDDAAQAIQAVRATGVKVLIATGRHHTAAMPYHHQLSLDTPLMCCNGTYAWDAQTGQTLFPRPLSKDQARQTLALVRQHAVHALVYVEGAMTFEAHEPHLLRLLQWADAIPRALRPHIHQVDDFNRAIDAAQYVWKFAVTAEDMGHLHAFTEAVQVRLGLSCEWSAKDRVDVAQTGNSKGRLLTDWLTQAGIAPAQTIAFGDSPNDMSMLEAVGLGVAMEHSNEAVRRVARRVAGSNDSPAIAQVLRHEILGQAT